MVSIRSAILLLRRNYSMADDLQQTFDKIKQAGKNNVDGLVKWLQDSGVIDKAKETETKVRSYFADVADKNDVPVAKFKEAVGKIADDQKKNINDLSKVLHEHGSTFLGALQAGASAFKDAMTKK